MIIFQNDFLNHLNKFQRTSLTFHCICPDHSFCCAPKHRHTELSYFVQLSAYKKKSKDYIQYIEHCIQLWEKTDQFKDYRTREYLMNELNTVGNKRSG